MRNLDIAASVFNLPPSVILTASQQGFSENLEEAGYEHMQYMPVRGLHAAAAERLVEDGTITSFHQSWMNVQKGSSLKDRLMQPVFPGIESSMRKIDALEKYNPLAQQLPIVVHPYGQHLGGKPAHHSVDYSRRQLYGLTAPLLHQPTAEVLDQWDVLNVDGVYTADRMLEVQAERGLSGVALDLHHLTTVRGGIDLESFSKNWSEEFVGTLAARGALKWPSEVQVSLRPDFGGEQAHLLEILDGHLDRTPHGRMMLAIAESLPEDQSDLRVTTEVPPSAWKIAGLTWQQGNRQLVEAIEASRLAG